MNQKGYQRVRAFNLKGNSRFIPLKDKTISCVFTSPPYYYLRKYDIPDQIWDVETNCDHDWGDQMKYKGSKPSHGVGSSSMTVLSVTKDIGSEGGKEWDSGSFCRKCGAWRGQLGLEPNFDAYIDHLIQIFDEVWRVMRDDGTFFLNIGDTYSTISGSMKDGICNSSYKSEKYSKADKFKLEKPKQQIQDKSLCGIPFRLATRLIDRGWRLRNTIIWKKPNGIPNSARDRFAVDFEYIFFFVKSSKYWFDQPLEPYDKPLDRWGGDTLIPKGISTWDGATGQGWYRVRNMRPNPEGRIKRSVWNIATRPYKGSHYASFPEALCEEIIKAGCPEFICKKCGKPRERIIEYEKSNWLEVTDDMSLEEKERAWSLRETKRIDKGLSDCGCGEGFEPGLILDPFGGAGTVMKTARKLGRIGVSLDLGYHELSKERSKSLQLDWV
jgi:DNA modification methylase